MLVCNHGVGDSLPVEDDTPEGWEHTMRINLTGPFLLARAALPHLLEQRGCVVTVSSVNGWPAGPGWASYCTSKAGLIMLTRCLANDYGPRGLRANCVCPGWVRTPMGDDDMGVVSDAWDVSTDDAYWLCSRDTPLRRPATPEEDRRGHRLPCVFAGRLLLWRGHRGWWRQRGGQLVHAFHGPPEHLRDLLRPAST